MMDNSNIFEKPELEIIYMEDVLASSDETEEAETNAGWGPLL